MASITRSILLTPLAVKAFQNTTLHASHSRLLWHLLTILPITGEVLSNTVLAKRFNTSPGNISLALKSLCTHGFIERDPKKTGRSYRYKPNPALIRILT